MLNLFVWRDKYDGDSYSLGYQDRHANYKKMLEIFVDVFGDLGCSDVAAAVDAANGDAVQVEFVLKVKP